MISNGAIKNILLRAKFYVSNGWTQGQFARGPDGGQIGWSCVEACSFCMSGAINRSTYDLGVLIGNMRSSRLETIVMDSIHSLFPRRYGSISIFNDDPDTTLAMVKAVLDNAIKNCEDVV